MQLYLSGICLNQGGFFLMLHQTRVEGGEVNNPDNGLEYPADLGGKTLGTCSKLHQGEDYRLWLQTQCYVCCHGQHQLFLLTTEHISYLSWPLSSRRAQVLLNRI